jgi:hypothetical protein
MIRRKNKLINLLNMLRPYGSLANDISPALLIFCISIAFSISIQNLPTQDIWEMFASAVIRFFRLTFFLCLPLFLLFPVYRFVAQKMKGALLRVDDKREVQIHPFTLWIARPFQGIGIGLFFISKLLTALTIMVGPINEPSLLFSLGQFQVGRFLSIMVIAIIVSILLSSIWTFDDMGIRYFNRKDQEIKMIGKYVGTLMPIIFGFYGILNLLENYPGIQVLAYLFKITFILYPPFSIFAVIHTYMIRNKYEFLSNVICLEKKCLD